MSVRAPSEKERAKAETRDEDRNHSGRRSRRAAEDEAELALPGDLIDQRARAGAEHQRREPEAHARHRRLGLRLVGLTDACAIDARPLASGAPDALRRALACGRDAKQFLGGHEAVGARLSRVVTA